MKGRFTAFDFETLYGHIPCSIGIVEFENGIPVKEYHSLIRPYSFEVNPINSRINRLSLEDVKNERDFSIIWNEIKELFESKILVCHNYSFDKSVLLKTLNFYNIEVPEFNLFCTHKISKQLLDLENYKLPTVAENFDIKGHLHHDSLSDALVCGKIFSRFLGEYNHIDFADLGIKIDQKFRSRNSGNSRQPILKADPYKWGNSEAFEGLSIVISGIFSRFSRPDLQQTIIANGGKLISSVSAKVDFLVAGENMGPSKLEKAQKLGVKIISEEEFISMLNIT